MKLGFTGTRNGMSAAQKRVFTELVRAEQPTEFHQGDCVGSDEESHYIVAAECPDARLIAHPPSDPSKRAFVTGAHETREPRPYLDRDRDIVDETERLVATPEGFAEERRSGTWYTVRYALKLRRPVTIIYPDGSVEQR